MNFPIVLLTSFIAVYFISFLSSCAVYLMNVRVAAN
jgi:hypothetical protein